jgi:hypothetical protein
MIQYGIRALVFNTEPGWVKQVELKTKFHRELILKWPNFKLQCTHGKNQKQLCGIGKTPQFMLLN